MAKNVINKLELTPEQMADVKVCKAAESRPVKEIRARKELENFLDED